MNQGAIGLPGAHHQISQYAPGGNRVGIGAHRPLGRCQRGGIIALAQSLDCLLEMPRTQSGGRRVGARPHE